MAVQVLPSIDRLPQPLMRFMDRLSEEQKLLLVLKRELYDGSWEPMIVDLTNRLGGKPFLVKLASRIEDDLERIEQMQQLERHYQVDLSRFVQELEDVETPA